MLIINVISDFKKFLSKPKYYKLLQVIYVSQLYVAVLQQYNVSPISEKYEIEA